MHISKNVSIQSCHISKKNKNGRFIFDFFGICPKWIKLDQIGFPYQFKNFTIKSCHIYRKGECEEWGKYEEEEGGRV
jgi:hypothetical protein